MKATDARKFGMTLIVKTITRLTVGLILLFGIYLSFYGDLQPGGGFVGGVVIALAFVHLTLGFGREATMRRLSLSAQGLFRKVSAPQLISVAMLGFLGGWFILTVSAQAQGPNRVLSAWIIPLCDIFITVNVGIGLSAIFISLVSLRVRKELKE